MSQMYIYEIGNNSVGKRVIEIEKKRRTDGQRQSVYHRLTQL